MDKITDKSLLDGLDSEIDSNSNHATLSTNPHATTKAQVGLGSCNNTSDADKPVSTATNNKFTTERATSNSNYLATGADSYSAQALEVGGTRRTASTSGAANTVSVVDGNGDLNDRLFKSTYGEQSSAPSSSADVCFRNSTSDSYMRFCTRDALRGYLNAGSDGGSINKIHGWVTVMPSTSPAVVYYYNFSTTCTYLSTGRYRVYMSPAVQTSASAFVVHRNSSSGQCRWSYENSSYGYIQFYTYTGSLENGGGYGHVVLFHQDVTLPY